MRWVWLFGLVVACKSDEAKEAMPVIPAPVTFSSGSRLHATFHEVDGVKIFTGWQDVQLGKPCEFFGDRCLPGTTRIESNDLALFEELSGIDTSAWPTRLVLDGDLDPGELAARFARKVR